MLDRERRVLVVDDDAATADLVADMLSLEGYDVQTAYSGLEAIKRANQGNPHVILLDLMMPLCDGVEVAQQLHASGVGSRIVVLSADSRAKEKAKKIGASGLLSKPFAIDDLVREVGRQFV